MKYLLLLSLLFAGNATASEEHEAGEMNGGATFKEGLGLSISPVMAAAINLQTIEAAEESMTPVFFAELQSYTTGRELSGWVKSGEAVLLKPGGNAELKVANKTFRGKVKKIRESAYAAGGDYEIVVEAEQEVAPGIPVRAVFTLPSHENVLVVPKSSLLTTAEGAFVYTKSGDFYVRTPVTVGSVSGEKMEILDGLYGGDEVVTTPVMQLWLAELQAIRGGQSCADGH